MAKKKSLRVNLFQVARAEGDNSLELLLEEISRVDLMERVRRVRTSDIRLEHVIPPGAEGNPSPYWLLDFVLFRDTHGPGKATRRGPIQGFDLLEDDFFGEETALLYDPVTNYLLAQYNHNGVKTISIESYINNFFEDGRAPSNYQFRMKLDQASEIKLAKKQLVTKMDFKIAPVKMTAAHLEAGVSLGRVLALNGQHDGASIEVVISAGKGQVLKNVDAILDGLRTFRQADQDQDTQAITRFNLEAKAELEDRVEKINMLMPALVQVIPGVEQGLDRRLTLKSRWDALARARRGWNDIVEG